MSADATRGRRIPRSVRRLSLDHRGETGIIVHRPAKAPVPWPTVAGWEVVTVALDQRPEEPLAELRSWLRDTRPEEEAAKEEASAERAPPGRPPVAVAEPARWARAEAVWIGLEPGTHAIDLAHSGEPLRTQTVRLAAGDHFLVAVRAPIWVPFRDPVPARWDLRLLPGPDS